MANRIMLLRTAYLFLCIAGTVLPLSQFLPWAAEHGLDFQLFFQELFTTRIGAFFGWDVIVSAVVLLVFVVVEGRRLCMQNLWLVVLATLCVGVSLGLPLFLYLRQGCLDRSR